MKIKLAILSLSLVNLAACAQGGSNKGSTLNSSPSADVTTTSDAPPAATPVASTSNDAAAADIETQATKMMLDAGLNADESNELTSSIMSLISVAQSGDAALTTEKGQELLQVMSTLSQSHAKGASLTFFSWGLTKAVFNLTTAAATGNPIGIVKAIYAVVVAILA